MGAFWRWSHGRGAWKIVDRSISPVRHSGRCRVETMMDLDSSSICLDYLEGGWGSTTSCCGINGIIGHRIHSYSNACSDGTPGTRNAQPLTVRNSRWWRCWAALKHFPTTGVCQEGLSPNIPIGLRRHGLWYRRRNADRGGCGDLRRHVRVLQPRVVHVGGLGKRILGGLGSLGMS